jgi:hypothetical protein
VVDKPVPAKIPPLKEVEEAELTEPDELLDVETEIDEVLVVLAIDTEELVDDELTETLRES